MFQKIRTPGLLESFWSLFGGKFSLNNRLILVQLGYNKLRCKITVTSWTPGKQVWKTMYVITYLIVIGGNQYLVDITFIFTYPMTKDKSTKLIKPRSEQAIQLALTLITNMRIQLGPTFV